MNKIKKRGIVEEKKYFKDGCYIYVIRNYDSAYLIRKKLFNLKSVFSTLLERSGKAIWTKKK